jgi:hypothetical protein
MPKHVWMLIFVLLIMPTAQFASPITELTMSSSPTDYVGQGQNYLFNLANTTSWDVFFYDYNEDGLPNAIYVQIQTDDDGSWNLTFGTNSFSENLGLGYYGDANSGPGVGQAFISIYGDGRGDAAVGDFTVLSSYFPPVSDTPTLAPSGTSFAISFSQTCCGIPTDPYLDGTLTGTLYYNYDMVATPEPQLGSAIGLAVAILLFYRVTIRRGRRA